MFSTVAAAYAAETWTMVKKNYDDILSRFHLIPERNKRTDGRRFIAISISCVVSILTRNKKDTNVGQRL